MEVNPDSSPARDHFFNIFARHRAREASSNFEAFAQSAQVSFSLRSSSE